MRFGILAGMAALMLAAAPVFSAPEDPVAIIKKKDAELQKMLRDKSASKQTDKIKVLINGIFDFEELGKRALGPETWKTMTPDQQKRFVKAFREMVENASVKKLEVYQSDSSTYEAPELGDGKASVTAHVWTKGSESVVTYKLLAKDGTWKAWDLIIDDLSTARNYGEQFRKILQTSNVDGLIAKLEKKGSGAVEGKPADSMKSKSEQAQPAKSGSTAGAAKKVPVKAPAAAPATTPAAQ
ncbi:MAG TPA: ABC transporter substrate-binding protein [Fibrobacteria bacterium]|nr:ABC transporter substrate-binding protein [Fibrobacteria bacterium]